MDRNLHIKGAKNTRDFYGIKNKEGRVINTHNFVRSCALDKLTRKDIKKLEFLQTIIDLRDNDEYEEKPDKKLPNAKNINLPVFSETTIGVSMSEKSIEALYNLPDFKDVYKRMVTEEVCVEHLKEIFKVITTTEGPILWHCSEGKDRCGIVSALFLSLLDVSYEEVMKDYLLTNDVPSKNKSRYYRLVLFLTRDKKKADLILPMFEAREEYLSAAFTAINETYGSVDNFLKETLGISDETKQKMKDMCLE